MIRDGEMVSRQTLDLFFYVQVVVPELYMMPCSTTVVRQTVNLRVEGSNPSEPVRILYPKLNILINTCDRANL